MSSDKMLFSRQREFAVGKSYITDSDAIIYEFLL